MKTTKDVNGATLVELPKQFERTKFAGGTLTRTFKGTRTDIIAQEDALIALNYKTKRTEGPLYLLEAVISNVADDSGTPDGTVTTDANGLEIIWEFDQNKTTKDLLEALNVPIIRSLPSEYKKYIKDQLTDPESTNKTFVPYLNPTMTSTDHSNALKIWKLLMHGSTTVDVTFPILRRTVTPNFNYALTGYTADDNRIISRSTLISNESIPTNYANLMPDYLYPDSSNSITFESLSYIYGYKKETLGAQQISLTKNQIVQTWTFGIYSVDIHGALL